ncbi:hypothetical protein ACFLW7_03470 [Chloroflexota bacterium]
MATRISGPVNGTFSLPSAFQEKQIRFAEDILVRALKAKAPDKPKKETKGKRKGKVLKYKKEDEHLVDDESEE